MIVSSVGLLSKGRRSGCFTSGVMEKVKKMDNVIVLIKFSKEEANHMQINVVPWNSNVTVEKIDEELERFRSLLEWCEVKDFEEMKEETDNGSLNYVSRNSDEGSRL